MKSLQFKQSDKHGDGKFYFEEMLSDKVENLKTAQGILFSQQGLLRCGASLPLFTLAHVTHNLCVIAPHRTHLLVSPIKNLLMAALKSISKRRFRYTGKAKMQLRKGIDLLIECEKNDRHAEDDEDKSVLDHSPLVQNVQEALMQTGAKETDTLHQARAALAGSLAALNAKVLEETERALENYEKLINK